MVRKNRQPIQNSLRSNTNVTIKWKVCFTFSLRFRYLIYQILYLLYLYQQNILYSSMTLSI